MVAGGDRTHEGGLIGDASVEALARQRSGIRVSHLIQQNRAAPSVYKVTTLGEKRVHRISFLARIALIACSAMLPGRASAQAEAPLTVRFLGVPRGAATWITTPDQQTIVVDCGDVTFGRQLVLQLQTLGVQRVAALATTQAAPELFGGCIELLSHSADLPVTSVLWNGQTAQSSALWQTFWSLFPTSVTPLTASTTLDWGPSAAGGETLATVLNPVDATQPSPNSADDGVVLSIASAGKHILLVGDINDAAASRIAALPTSSVDVMAVAAPTIGPKAANALVQAFQPATVVLTYASVKGPPGDDTRAQWAIGGARVMSTVDNGTITVTVGDSVSFKP
jgi:competence protein ComEC